MVAVSMSFQAGIQPIVNNRCDAAEEGEKDEEKKKMEKSPTADDGLDDMLNKVENMVTWQTHISFYEQQ